MTTFAESWKELSERIAAFAVRMDELVSLLEAEPPEDGYAESGWKLLAKQVLDERHAIALALRSLDGLEHDATTPSGDTLADLALADRDLERELWRLTAINEHRQRKLEEIAPEERELAWWYARGAHLHPAAVLHLGAVAAVVACFPEAREELEALGEAEDALVRMSAEAIVPKERTSGTITSREVLQASLPSVDAVALTADEAATPNSDVRDKMLSRLGWLLSAAAVLVAVGSGLSYKSAAENAEREKAVLLQQAEAMKAESDLNVRRLKEQLKTSPSRTLSVALPALLEGELTQAQAAAAASEDVRKMKASGGASKPAASKPAACPKGDPMCGD